MIVEDYKSICAGKNRKNTASFLELAKANIIAAKIIKAKHAALLLHLTAIQNHLLFEFAQIIGFILKKKANPRQKQNFYVLTRAGFFANWRG